MKSDNALPNLVSAVIVASLLLLSGCGGGGSSGSVTGGGAAIIFPAVNPAFDSITEVALSPEPGSPYNEILVPEREYSYEPDTESITVKGGVEPGGEYVRITGLATVSGTQESYTIYTFITRTGDQVAANELTSTAVGLVASGDAADFKKALALVEAAYGLPAGSAAEPLPAAERPAELTSVLAAAAPAFAEGADPAFDIDNTTTEALAAGQAAYMDCVAQGGLAYDSWHKTDAGGSGLPTDEPDNDYTRCKACHGWDQQGTEGGYDQRDRTAGRANAGYQDPNNCDLQGADPATCTPSRNISTDATFGRGASLEIPVGGRTWAQGSAVFDRIDPEWGPGAILGNRHPDLSPDNPEGPTARQLSCLTAFLNAPMARADQVYAAIDTMPADGEDLNIYTPVATANAAAGEAYYDASCRGCHGDPSDDGVPDVGGLIAYLNKDGKFSEFMHKMHWGIPNTIMSRAAMGEPAAADVADVVAWMQAIPFRELSAAQEVPAVPGITARGSGIYTLTDAGLEYVINVDRSNLSGPIRSAHFHLGRVGTNGGVVRTLEFTGGGQAIGIWTSADDQPLTPDLRQALLDGHIYVNVHTDANPSGEIRGQVGLTPEGGNQPPVADAGEDQAVDTGSEVTLDGSGSFDPDAWPAPLTYAWTLDSVPAGSTATLVNADTASPTFTADLDGIYTASLVVNDGQDDSEPDSVIVTASGPSGSFEAGRAKYDADCAGCHAAGSYDPGGFAGDIAGKGNLLVNDLGTLNSSMAGIFLTDQEILDLQAFLDDPSIQP